jgi:tRNA pseudouridine38-40 synthase
MRNLKIVVEYDGTGYYGWQRQKDLATVQQVLEDTVFCITGELPVIFGSGRTDAGVHALRQTAHFKTSSCIIAAKLLAAMNSLLPKDIVIKELQEVPESFHARFDVKSKVYRYQILNSPIRSALYRQYSWHIRNPLDLGAMERGLAVLKGRHDFTAFCGKKEPGYNCIRTITDGRLEKNNSGIISIYLEADGFLRYMVRSVVGTLVEVGKGKRTPEGLFAVLQAKDRSNVGITAPAQGLFLIEVKY